MIDLHFLATPNNWKIVIMLEETGFPYTVTTYDTRKGEQLQREYGAINPNYKLPAIVDNDPPQGDAPYPVFESGAILLYLAEKSGKFLPSDLQAKSLVHQWLIWQVAGLGPIFGQASHFIRYARGHHQYSIDRFHNEAVRLTHILDNRLGKSEYLADDYSIADIAIWPLIGVMKLVKIDISEFPNIARWHALIGDRPAVKRAYTNPLTAPDPSRMLERTQPTDETWSNNFGDNYMAAVRRA